MHAAQFILYVADQARARDFYRRVLGAEPVLDVPGMTEFDLGGATLGLMPAADMEALLSGQIRAGAGQRCELYLRRSDAAAALARAADGGGRLLDGLRDRSWGERAGYLLDPDGHVLALAAAGGGRRPLTAGFHPAGASAATGVKGVAQVSHFRRARRMPGAGPGGRGKALPAGTPGRYPPPQRVRGEIFTDAGTAGEFRGRGLPRRDGACHRLYSWSREQR